MLHRALALSLTFLGLAVAPLGCTAETADDGSDLTSITARERLLTFEGYVYVDVDASTTAITEAVKRQTRSAFGALLEADVAVQTRELANVDAKTFVKERVTVVDADGPTGEERLRVHYRYTDRAIVPKTMASRGSLSLGLLHGDYPKQAERVLAECTKNGPDEREMARDVWYVFNPSLAACKKAMKAEQTAIDALRADVGAEKNEVVTSEVGRLYVPMTARLAATPESGKTAYPEYDRLWSGGITPGVLTATLLTGLIDHAKPGEIHHEADDLGYWETMATLDELFYARPKLDLVKVEPAIDLANYKVGTKKVSGVEFRDLVDWNVYETGWPTGLSATERKELERQAAKRLRDRWLTFEEQVSVSIGGAPAKPTTVRVQLYFGADEAVAPYRRAIQTSDVLLYNGHSYVGEGPLDPANFAKKDFPQSYQLFFIDSCISYNYYNADYFGFKARGSADLDMITNGVESEADGSGAAQGRFLAKLLSGKAASYRELLETASTTGTDYAWGKDALRVVEGESDNRYSPKLTPIKLLAK
ncbi:MAG: hypothetical protein FJ096_09850 [Deltaproteobacteria bacterium]|nr:hypothetical protein [Deltaproteobacteria bacterium]